MLHFNLKMSETLDHDDSTNVPAASFSKQDSTDFSSTSSNVFKALRCQATNLLNNIDELEKFSLSTGSFTQEYLKKIEHCMLVMSNRENELSYHIKNLIGFHLAIQKTISFCQQDPPVCVSLPDVKQDPPRSTTVSQMVEHDAPPNLSSEEILQFTREDSDLVRQEYSPRKRKRISVVQAVECSANTPSLQDSQNVSSEQVSEPEIESSKTPRRKYSLRSQAKSKKLPAVPSTSKQAIDNSPASLTPHNIPTEQESHWHLRSLKKSNEYLFNYFESCLENLRRQFNSETDHLNILTVEYHTANQELLITLFLFLLKEYVEFVDFLEGSEYFLKSLLQISTYHRTTMATHNLAFVKEDFLRRLPEVEKFYKDMKSKYDNFYKPDPEVIDLSPINPTTEPGESESITGYALSLSSREEITQYKPATNEEKVYGDEFTLTIDSELFRIKYRDLEEIQKAQADLFYENEIVFSLIVSCRDCSRAIVDKCYQTKAPMRDVQMESYIRELLYTVEGFKIIRSEWAKCAEKMRYCNIVILKMKLKVALLIQQLMHNLLDKSFTYWTYSSEYTDFY